MANTERMRNIHKDLKNWLLNKQAKDIVVNSFWNSFNNYREEDPEEFIESFSNFEVEYITFEFSKASVVIKGWDRLEEPYNENMEYIEILISVFYRTAYIGYYALSFNAEDNVIDDRLVWE